jgi:hypothetical protein
MENAETVAKVWLVWLPTVQQMRVANAESLLCVQTKSQTLTAPNANATKKHEMHATDAALTASLRSASNAMPHLGRTSLLTVNARRSARKILMLSLATIFRKSAHASSWIKHTRKLN